MERKTGRYRFRSSITGKLILQLEYLVPYNYDPTFDLEPGGYTEVWRDAKVSDVDAHYLINLTGKRHKEGASIAGGENVDPRW
jgi:hypothetical protein